MKRLIYTLSGAAVVLALAMTTPDAWAQARGHGGGGSGSGGGGGTRTNSGGSGGGGGTAVSRGSGGSGGGHVSSSGGSGGTVRPSGGARASSGGSSSGDPAVVRGGDRRNADGRPIIGQAVPRNGRYTGRDGYYYYPYNPYYLYGYGAFGLGAFYYDPFWWGYYPYGGYYPGYGYGYGYGYEPGYGSYDAPDVQEGVKGGLKLKVSPTNAEVYVDGYYVGVVDDYNGVFQRLNLVEGVHRIEVKAPGYQTLSFEVKIEPRETISYHGDLVPAGPAVK